MANRITYPMPDWSTRKSSLAACEAQKLFNTIASQFKRKCTTCGGTGEYESEQGPKGCNLCNSRLYPVITVDGRHFDLDYGDTLIIENNQLVNVEQVKHDLA
jgi:hypothetical protein